MYHSLFSKFVGAMTSSLCLADCFKKIMSPSDSESNITLQTTLLLDDSGLIDLSWGIADFAVVIPRPFATLWREIELIIFVGLITLICTALLLFALISLVLQEVIVFLSLDNKIPKSEEALFFYLLL